MNKTILWTILILILVVGGFWFWNKNKTPDTSLPQNTEESTWRTFADSTTGTSFNYPDTFDTKYISLQDWPPQIQVMNSSFMCTETEGEPPSTAQIKKEIINGHEYCVIKVTEGAAGSTYTHYAYGFPEGTRTAALKFTLRFSQCGNYEKAEKEACEEERNDFDINKTIDRIAQTVIIP